MIEASISKEETDPAFMGMKGDVIQALDRRMDLCALLPAGHQISRNFVAWAYGEARKRRKKPIFLSPMSDIDWIRSAVIDARGGEGRGEGVASIGKGVLTCPDDTSYVDASDILNHCFRDRTIDECPFQSDFDLDIYREARSSGGSVIGEMQDEMREKGMCPARTALDLAVEAEAVIVHYSLIFSEDWRSVMDFLERDPKDTVLIVYDPSSLIKYLNRKYTYRFPIEDLNLDRFDLKGTDQDDRASVEILLELLSDLSGKTDPKKQIGRRLLIEGYRKRAKERGLSPHLSSPAGVLKTALEKGEFRTISDRKMAKDLYMALKLWMGQYTAVSRVRTQDETGDGLEVSLVDLSVRTASVLNSFSSVFLFGESLYPHTIFSNMLGMRSDRIMNRTYVEKDTLARTSVMTLGNVDTSYKHRSERSYARIAENISRISDTTRGLKLVVMPSHFILESVMQAMASVGFEHAVVEESRDMTRDQRKELVEEVRLESDITALTVQGGYLESAVRRGKISPEAIILVGVHIPPPSPRSKQMKLHLQKKYGPNVGHVISVLMPAMQKVMNTVNGMVSAQQERKNLVMLMDRRYHDRRVLECLPRFYDVKLLNDSTEFDGSRYLEGPR